MKVQPLSVGPIVGHTTSQSVRLWGRGEHQTIPSGPRRCFGAARVKGPNLPRRGEIKIFKMKGIFDFTGVVDFDGLDANTAYRYWMGYFFSDEEGVDQITPSRLNWDDIDEHRVRTAPGDDGAVSFVFGSCRYLLRLFGGSFFDDRGDKTYRSINWQLDSGEPIDLALMVGDQIYADDLNKIDPDRTLEQFFARYRDSFSQPQIRRLMSRIPTYMTMDDHEIEDNWTQDRYEREWSLFGQAMHAYECYQMVHSPAFERQNDERMAETPEKYWYTFDHGIASYFVLDTRTERFVKDTPPSIVGARQMEELKRWLTDQGDRVKFIVSAVPFFPDYKNANDDKWSGFPEQRIELLEHIRANNVRKVVFLSGDVHCSMSAQLHCSVDDDFRVTSIISSSFFWPYPQGRRYAFQLDGVLVSSGGADYELEDSDNVNVISRDNFTRVEVSPDHLEVRVYDRKGAELERRTLRL